MLGPMNSLMRPRPDRLSAAVLGQSRFAFSLARTRHCKKLIAPGSFSSSCPLPYPIPPPRPLLFLTQQDPVLRHLLNTEPRLFPPSSPTTFPQARLPPISTTAQLHPLPAQLLSLEKPFRQFPPPAFPSPLSDHFSCSSPPRTLTPRLNPLLLNQFFLEHDCNRPVALANWPSGPQEIGGNRHGVDASNGR